MPGDHGPVERLIDQGLERYGKGDLDGALIAWESALALAPDDPRAAGYVEYVRGHYDLLRGQGGAQTDSELAVPFGLSDLHDSDRYDVEIDPDLLGRDAPQRLERPPIEAFIDRVDDGWFLDEDLALPPLSRPLPLPARPESADLGAAPMTLELEADEPAEADRDTPLPGFGPWGGRPPGEPLAPLPPFRRGTGDDDQTHDFAPARLSRLPDFDQLDAAHPFDDPAETGVPPPRIEAVEPSPDHPGGRDVPDPPDPDDDDQDFAARTRDRGAPGRDPGEFDFEDRDETAELGKRHLGFVRLAPESDDARDGRAASAASGVADREPGSAFAGPEVSTAELKVRVKAADVAAAARPTLEPAAAQPDPAADLDLPDPAASKTSTLDLGPAGGAAPRPDDDERTQERAQWTRARTPSRAASPTRQPSPTSSALDHLDLDLGGSPSIAPPVIVDDPVMSEPSAFDPAHRNMPTRELPRDVVVPKPQRTTQDWPPTPTTQKTVPRAKRVAPPSAPPPPNVPPPDISAPTIAQLVAELDVGAPAGEGADDRTRRRITTLLERAAAAGKAGRHAEAVAACDLALAEAPDSAVAQKLVHRSQGAIVAVYQGYLGDLGARPSLAVPMHELSRQQLDTRAAFLLSRVDGGLSYEEILDVSGMTRLEALRHLARLVGRGILAVR